MPLGLAMQVFSHSSILSKVRRAGLMVRVRNSGAHVCDVLSCLVMAVYPPVITVASA